MSGSRCYLIFLAALEFGLAPFFCRVKACVIHFLIYLKIIGLIKFLVPINIHNFVFSPYKIKSHFLVPVTFYLSILGTKNVDGFFL